MHIPHDHRGRCKNVLSILALSHWFIENKNTASELQMCRIPLLPAGQHLLLLTWVKLVFTDFVEVIILANTNMHPYRSKHYTWNQVVSCFVFCFFTCHLTCFGGPLSPCTAHPNVKLYLNFILPTIFNGLSSNHTTIY